jgi:hypothetical protein
METEHIVAEPVRAYLLGQLADPEAVALEEKYFMDPSFFHSVQTVEQGLIEDYLDDRLPRSERRQFESRYLKVPALRQRLEEVRAQWTPSPPAPRVAGRWAWRAAFAAAVICVAGVAAWIYVHQHRARPPVMTQTQHPQNPGSQQGSAGTPVTISPHKGTVPPLVAKAQHPHDNSAHRKVAGLPAKTPPNERAVPSVAVQALPPQDFSSLARLGGLAAEPFPNDATGAPVTGEAAHPSDMNVLTVNLNSTLTGGAGYGGQILSKASPRVRQFQLPPAGVPIRFVVHLPIGTSTIICTPEISILAPDGHWTKVWTSGQNVSSVAVFGGLQELTITVDSSLFHPDGHYSLRLLRPEMPTAESYPFDVAGPR